MQITRRSMLLQVGLAGVVSALALTACETGGGSDGATPSAGDGTTGPTDATPSGGAPSGDQVRSWLEELVAQTGRDAFQEVVVSLSGIRALVLAEDGGVTEHSHDDGWEEQGHTERDVLTSTTSRTVAELPLDHLEELFGLIEGDDPRLTIRVDHAGIIRAIGDDGDFHAGLLTDGSALVPQLDLESIDGVRAAIAELVADYGTAATAVGSFNGFVHMDANVDGVGTGLRIVRRPEVAAEARPSPGAAAPYPQEVLFDPTGFDPTIALERMSTIVGEAGLEGEVWDWRYHRPPQGGEPMVSFGVGESGAEHRVWIAADGRIVEIVDGDCEPGAAFCVA